MEKLITSEIRLNKSYLIYKNGYIYYDDIYRLIESKPQLKGLHIFEQMKKLQWFEEFQKCGTPFSLPYSF